MYGYIFFSKSCNKCRDLMTIMENQGLIYHFTLQDVDEYINNGRSAELEHMFKLKYVPAILIINDANGNTTHGLYEGDNAFKWVDTVIYNRRQTMIKQSEEKRRIVNINDMKRKLKDGMYDYSISEMEGISDDYTHWKKNIDDDTNVPHQKAFMPYGQDRKYEILTIPMTKEDIKKCVLKEDDTKKLISDIQKERNMQDNEMKKTMETDRINVVANALNINT